MSLLASIVAAAATGIAGMGFAATIFFRHDADGSSSLVSPILIAVAFAALIFGAHCLDRIDAVDHAARVSKLKEKLHIDSL